MVIQFEMRAYQSYYLYMLQPCIQLKDIFYFVVLIRAHTWMAQIVAMERHTPYLEIYPVEYLNIEYNADIKRWY